MYTIRKAKSEMELLHILGKCEYQTKKKNISYPLAVNCHLAWQLQTELDCYDYFLPLCPGVRAASREE